MRGPCVDPEAPEPGDRAGARVAAAEVVEQILDQVALGQAVGELQAREADGRLAGEEVRDVALAVARARALGQAGDDESEHLVAGDERRDQRGEHVGRAPERAREQGGHTGASRGAAQLVPELGQRHEVRPVTAAVARRAQPQLVPGRLEQVHAQRGRAEQVHPLLDRRSQQLVDRVGARDREAEARQLLEVAHRAPGALVQARVLHRLRDEGGGVDQEGRVVGAEHPGCLGVQRDHADHLAAADDQRHRDERLVLLLLELREVADARVGQRVLGDEHRLAVLEHPARDPLARLHRDAAAQVRVLGGGGAQREAPAAVVDQEDVGRVRDDGVVHEPHDRREHAVDLERRVDRVDDLVQEAEFALVVGSRRRGGAHLGRDRHQLASSGTAMHRATVPRGAREGCVLVFMVRTYDPQAGTRCPSHVGKVDANAVRRAGIRSHRTPLRSQAWSVHPLKARCVSIDHVAPARRLARVRTRNGGDGWQPTSRASSKLPVATTRSRRCAGASTPRASPTSTTSSFR